ncbi:MAG TPA: P1 family peptidase [Gemmatimonadota bacterium]|nr:P1 family peptidase [Gemmatimonadota bacterium]
MRGTTALALMALLALPAGAAGQESRPRVRELGIVIGALPPGPLNAITDVPGVGVGQVTLVEGDSIRTGVTVIAPHPGNVFLEKVPGAIHVANGFGKLAGVTQVRELGTIETPIALTNTLAVGRVVDGLARWTRERTGEDVRSVNAVVGETNDGYLNAIGVPRVGVEEVRAALDSIRGGPVREGSVGAGTGTMALGFKGGIGTASRRAVVGDSVRTLGVLVQSNFGGALEIAGVPVGRRLGKAEFLEPWIPPAEQSSSTPPSGDARWSAADQPDAGGGSIMIVVATDAPVDAAGLARVARRAPYAIGRVGGFSSHGSGDYVIAFSNHPDVLEPHAADAPRTGRRALRGEALNPLFLAVIEATEEAILNSLLSATTVTGWRGTAEAIPPDRLRELLARP